SPPSISTASMAPSGAGPATTARTTALAGERWAIAPYFLVHDVVSTANWYRDVLGFRYERFWGEPPSFCMVKRGEIVIMLPQVDGATVRRRPDRTPPRRGKAAPGRPTFGPPPPPPSTPSSNPRAQRSRATSAPSPTAAGTSTSWIATATASASATTWPDGSLGAER